jgi:protein TonB
MIAETQPADLDIKRRLGELYVLANQSSEAIKVLADVARSYLDQGRRADAITALNQVLKLDSSDPATMTEVAHLSAKCGLSAEAERYHVKTHNDHGLARELATAEILLGLGRPDRAIALLKDLLERNPNDLTIETKLKDLSLMSGVSEPAPGLEADTEPKDRTEPERELASPAARLLVTKSRIRKPAKRKYVIAALVLLAALGAGRYLLVGSSDSDQVRPLAQVDPIPTASPAAPTASEEQAEPSDQSAGSGYTRPAQSPDQSTVSTRDSSGRKEAQRTAEPETRSRTVSSDATPPPQSAGPLKPTPPNVGAIGAITGAPGEGSSVAPAALLRDLPPAPPPPTPTPTVRRAAVMSGGEILRRVTPVYPQAARAAHITGTVTVEISINEHGNVVGVRATSGSGMLAGAAESAARGFKFTPATLDGVPVRATRTVLFHFKD